MSDSDRTSWVRITPSTAHIVKVGKLIREYGYGAKVDSIVTYDATNYHSVVDGLEQWSWSSVTLSGRPLDYLITVGHEHYGPEVYLRLDKEPINLSCFDTTEQSKNEKVKTNENN